MSSLPSPSKSPVYQRSPATARPAPVQPPTLANPEPFERNMSAPENAGGIAEDVVLAVAVEVARVPAVALDREPGARPAAGGMEAGAEQGVDGVCGIAE